MVRMDLFAAVFTKGADGILCACQAENLGDGWSGAIIGFRCICGALPLCFESGNFYLDSRRCVCEREVVIHFGPKRLGAMIFCPDEAGMKPRTRKTPKPQKRKTPKPQKQRKWSSDAAFLKECGIAPD